MRVRTYGDGGPPVLLLHGGPGAPGSMAPVARGLADRFRALEPFQRGSGATPLTVRDHVADLDALIEAESLDRPALVGSSWGAMLALAYAADHPERAGPLVLIGCGTFDTVAREELERTLRERTPAALARRLAGLADEIPDADARLQAYGEAILPLYVYDAHRDDQELEPCDARANRETWDDMLRLQAAGVYPAAFRAIGAPVLMLHGAYDPHPGGLVRASLAPHLPQLEYREWERCGHYPWNERAVRDEFFGVLRAWLAEHTAAG